MLQDINTGKASTSFLALSCFTTAEKAEAFYASLRKAFRNVSISVGESLAEGYLTNEDGRKPFLQPTGTSISTNTRAAT